jgi:signal transduction histidine kinase
VRDLFKSLQVQAALAITLVLVATGIWFTNVIADQANQALSQRTLAALENDAMLLKADRERGGIESLVQRIPELIRANGGAGLYRLQTSAGQSLAGNLDRWPDDVAPVHRGAFRYGSKDALDTRLAVGVSLDVGQNATLLIGRDIEDQRELARRIRWLGWSGVVSLSVLGLGLGLIARRRLLARIGVITDTSRAIIAGDLTQRIVRDNSGDELDRLSENLNDMLSRIETLLAALREVSDNIAHDLRTPLNRLRNQAEAALRESTSPAAQREGLERVIEQSDDLIKTFNALLLIARLEPGTVAATMETLDVGKLVDDVADLYQPVAEDAGLGLVIDVAKGAQLVKANRQLLGQAIANLIDNAIKYSADSPSANARPITVSTVPSADSIDVVVCDSGPGIAPEDRERALKRFVRLEKSRSLPGTGLGLSLVAAVARMHNAHLALDDNNPGLKVILSMKRLNTET